MAEYTLSEVAIEDLKAIYKYGHTTHGEPQAEKYQHGLHGMFELLSTFSGMGLPVDITGHDFYHFGYGMHVIVYSKTRDGINIEFLFHSRMKWLNRLRQWST